MERQKTSTERASPTGSAQCRIFSRRRSYIPAAVPVSIMSSDVFVQQLFPGFPADTTVKTAAVPEVVRRRSWQRQKPSPQDSHKPQVTAADRKTWERYVLKNRPCDSLYGRLSGTYCSQVATRTPIWERHPFGTDCQSTFQTRTMLPSPHKTTDLGAPSLQNCLSIKSLNLHNTPKSLQERRLESIRFQKKSFPKSCKGIFPKHIAPR